MFGKNETEPLLKDHDGLSLDVVEVFPTIQGEGPFAGRPATFIRLAGCHLKCSFCDTDFTSNRALVTVFELGARVEKHRHGLVVLTGGEPMRQNIVPLCEALVAGGYTVQIETAGSFWPQGEYAKHFEALVIAGQSYRIRESLTLDLCRTCVRKALAHLGLSTDVCELPEPVPQIGDPERPSSGALTEEDLRQLGLADPESLRA